jgi:hypothetical protein
LGFDAVRLRIKMGSDCDSLYRSLLFPPFGRPPGLPSVGIDDEALAADMWDPEALAEPLEHQQVINSQDRKYMETKSRMYSRSQRSSGGDGMRRSCGSVA